MPRVCVWLAPRPSASRPIAASIAPPTAPTKLAAMKGIRLGMISRKTSPSSPAPLARATAMYDRSRIESTCARIVRVGNIQASAATVRAITSTVICSTLRR